jgi:hypothetical protein
LLQRAAAKLIRKKVLVLWTKHVGKHPAQTIIISNVGQPTLSWSQIRRKKPSKGIFHGCATIRKHFALFGRLTWPGPILTSFKVKESSVTDVCMKTQARFTSAFAAHKHNKRKPWNTKVPCRVPLKTNKASKEKVKSKIKEKYWKCKHIAEWTGRGI